MRACSQRGRDRLLNEGLVRNVVCVQANAERLPFAPRHFDCITIGFGLRNVTDKAAALASMGAALKPGGQLLVLEFSHPTVPILQPLYDAYSFHVLPLLGRLVAGDEEELSLSRRVHTQASGPGGSCSPSCVRRVLRAAATTISPAASWRCIAATATEDDAHDDDRKHSESRPAALAARAPTVRRT